MSTLDGGPWTALILAGSRGPSDPVAAHCGVRHKALAPVGGEPMVLRVLRSLEASPRIGRIVLCVEAPDLLAGEPAIAEMIASGRFQTMPTAASPSLSVGAALDRLEQPFPLLVTTADHPLLTPAMIEHFCAAIPGEADVAAALAPASLVRRDHPGAVRTFYKLGREAYSGCNLFAFRSPQARRAASFWAEMERYRKRPARLIAAIGPVTLLRFALGLIDLGGAERLLSKRLNVTVRLVEMPFAEAAIDVDKPADLILADSILRGRAAT